MGVHQETHKKNRTGDFHCKECGKSFLYKKTLKTHQLTHSENADQFKCKVCDKEFRLKDYLKKHELIHDIERTFSCHLTRKKYSTSNDLSTHLHLHKNKSFACKRCPKTFKFLIRLERHERWHKNIAVTKRFRTNGTSITIIDNAIKIVTLSLLKRKENLLRAERKPFTCSECCERFMQKKGLKAHTLRVHSVPKTHTNVNDLLHVIGVRKGTHGCIF